MNPFVSRKEIRFHHCDPAGIVFYPQYFVLFHELLEDWFNLGLAVPYADFIGRQRLGIPTVHVSSDFIAASRLGDQIDLTLTVAHLDRSAAAGAAPRRSPRAHPPACRADRTRSAAPGTDS